MSAEEDIRKTISQFANSFDLKDLALMESALADVLTVDYSDLRGDSPKSVTAREYAQARREALDPLHAHANPQSGRVSQVYSGNLFGMVKLNLLPCPTTLSNQIRPPWASTIPFAMLNPKPAPPDERDRDGSPR